MSKNTIDLCAQCFSALNSYKRHRALTNIKRTEGRHDEANFNELKMFQFFDNLELGLRALQHALYDEERRINSQIKAVEETDDES